MYASQGHSSTQQYIRVEYTYKIARSRYRLYIICAQCECGREGHTKVIWCNLSWKSVTFLIKIGFAQWKRDNIIFSTFWQPPDFRCQLHRRRDATRKLATWSPASNSLAVKISIFGSWKINKQTLCAVLQRTAIASGNRRKRPSLGFS